MASLVRSIGGEFVLPAPGGDVIRDGAGVLPTGRNIHALDPYRIPSAVAMERGRTAARLIIEAHRKKGESAVCVCTTQYCAVPLHLPLLLPLPQPSAATSPTELSLPLLSSPLPILSLFLSLCFYLVFCPLPFCRSSSLFSSLLLLFSSSLLSSLNVTSLPFP
jgi:CobN/Magnesium Chelatase